MDIIVIYCTVPDKQIAKDITNILLKHKLAACVSMIDKVRSKFSWDGEICEEKEILMMIKTRRTNYGKIKLVIEDIHPYTVPEIIALPIVDFVKRGKATELIFQKISMQIVRYRRFCMNLRIIFITAMIQLLAH